MTRMDAHALSELRSLAYHRRVAELLREDPSRLAKARAFHERWGREPGRSVGYWRRWQKLLDGPLDTLLGTLIDESEDAAALRACSPFPGYLTPPERWQLWREGGETSHP
jgi:hypothetical protein